MLVRAREVRFRRALARKKRIRKLGGESRKKAVEVEEVSAAGDGDKIRPQEV